MKRRTDQMKIFKNPEHKKRTKKQDEKMNRPDEKRNRQRNMKNEQTK